MFDDSRIAVIEAIRSKYGTETVTREQILAWASENSTKPPYWWTTNPNYRASAGVYYIPENDGTILAKLDPIAKAAYLDKRAEQTVIELSAEDTEEVGYTQSVKVDDNSPLIPKKQKGYVPFGNYNDVEMIINSRKFYPVFITGLSGNGKTVMVEQICAVNKREMLRVNITEETDEDDLIGGYRLIDGNTVWQDGPVVVAMKAGAILLLDEVDLGSIKMMCLQPVLEGRSIYVKKTNTLVTPAPGFNIIATANTKGKGSDDGRFVGTNILNEAFLERFSVTMEQEYPDKTIERKILKNVLKSSKLEADKFVTMLVDWAERIRKTYYETDLDEIISTRRLIHICEAYAIFGENRLKAIQLCLNRFDDDTKTQFLDFYTKIDEEVRVIEKNEKKPAVAVAKASTRL